MKTLAKLMAFCMLLGTLGFAQAAPAEKKGDDMGAKKSDTMKKPKKAKKGKKKAAAKKGAAEDKGMDKGMDKK